MRILLPILLLLLGCASTASDPAPRMPEVPQVQTNSDQQCVMHCQTNYTACLGACPRVVAGTAAASVRYECQTNCKELLAQCYTLCVGRQEDPS